MDQISNENLKAFINEIAGRYELYAPVTDKDNTTLYKKISSFSEYDASKLLTATTAKDKIYLQSERMFGIKKNKDNVEIDTKTDIKKACIFGCRPCDAKGFDVIDKLFSWSGCNDEYYNGRRSNTVIVTVSCENPADTCFCTSFKNGGPANSTGSDILLTPVKGSFLAEIITERGAEFIKGYEKYFDKSGDNAKTLKEEFVKQAEAKITKKIDTAKVKTVMNGAFESDYWDTVHLPCVKCGVCTFVCPTCYCFDISEKMFDNMNSERNRTWDTCMSETFTLMAGGINPRSDTKKRFRQRFMHKFCYHIDNFKEELCTGCGRCIVSCPAGIDIRKVLEEVR